MKSKQLTFLTLIFLPFLMAIFIKGCSFNAAGALKPFKVGLNTWPGYQVALYAQATGLFRKHGLEVEFVRFTNQQDNIRSTMRGAQDASFVPLAEVIQVDPNQEAPVYIMVADISTGSDGIVAESQITSVKDLKGKKVSVKLGTVPHLVLLEALKANQLQPNEIEIVDAINERGAAMLKQGKVSASVLWEPLLSNTAKAEGRKVIYTTADVDSVVIDGLATRSSITTTKQDELTRFIETWFDVMKDLETKPQEVFASVAKQLGTTVEIFAKDYAGLKKGDLEMNRRMFEGGRLQAASEQTRQLLLADPRHGRLIRDYVEINAQPIVKATKNWKQ